MWQRQIKSCFVCRSNLKWKWKPHLLLLTDLSCLHLNQKKTKTKNLLKIILLALHSTSYTKKTWGQWKIKYRTKALLEYLHQSCTTHFAWVKNMTTFPRTTSHNDILGMSQKNDSAEYKFQAHAHTHTNKIHFKDASLNLHSKPLLHQTEWGTWKEWFQTNRL